MQKPKIDNYEITLKWDEDYEEKFGSKQNLVNLYNQNWIIKNALKDKIFFGEIIGIKQFLNNNVKKYDIFTVELKNIGIRIDSIEMSKDKQDILVKITPIEPKGSIISEHLLKNGRLYLHPRVPNLGTKDNKKLIPVTFDLIYFSEPSTRYSQEIN